MLWWEDISNRKKVIKVYGSIAILFYAVYWVLNSFENEEKLMLGLILIGFIAACQKEKPKDIVVKAVPP